MSNEEFRRDLNRVFDGVAGSPSSNLRDRVRASVTEAPEARGPYWIAGLAACVMAVIIIGLLYVGGPLKPPSSVGGVHPTPSTTVSPSPVTEPTAQPSATPGAQLFVCANRNIIAQGTPAPVGYVSALRTGAHPGYDRLTIEFSTVMPGKIEITTQSGTRFVLSPSGLPVTLKGQNGILVTIRGADMHTSYGGAGDIVTGYKALAEVRRVQDFEGVVQLGLGISGPACYRTTVLSNPNRLVIDVQSAA